MPIPFIGSARGGTSSAIGDDTHSSIGDFALEKRAASALKARLRKRGLAVCISGVDGSGKTTLARQLSGLLTAAGMPARHFHLYQWYVNLFMTPLLLIYNRYFGRSVFIFDRSIYDNVAVVSIARRPRWLLPGILDAVLKFYPDFDYGFYLVAPLEETLRRRPETSAQRVSELTAIYDKITERVGHHRLPSDRTLLGLVLSCLAGDDRSLR